MKQKIVPIISVVIGIIAFCLTARYLRTKHDELEKLREHLYKGATKIQVIVAARDIPAGTVVEKGDIGMKTAYEIEISRRGRVVTVEDAEQILGRKTRFHIGYEEEIYWSDIEGGGGTDTGLAELVTPGLRAISLSVGGGGCSQQYGAAE